MSNTRTDLRADEREQEKEGEIRISILKNGGRRLVHPSGRECIESPDDITRRVTDAQAMVADAQSELTDTQALVDRIVTINTVDVTRE